MNLPIAQEYSGEKGHENMRQQQQQRQQTRRWFTSCKQQRRRSKLDSKPLLLLTKLVVVPLFISTICCCAHGGEASENYSHDHQNRLDSKNQLIPNYLLKHQQDTDISPNSQSRIPPFFKVPSNAISSQITSSSSPWFSPRLIARRMVSRLFMDDDEGDFLSRQQQQQNNLLPGTRLLDLLKAQLQQRRKDRKKEKETKDNDDSNSSNHSVDTTASQDQSVNSSSQFGGGGGTLSVTAALVGDLLRDRQRLLSWTLSGIQIALAFYLGNVVLTAVSEIIDELIEEQQDGGSNFGGVGTGEPLAVKRDELARVLAFLEQEQQEGEKESLSSSSTGSSATKKKNKSNNNNNNSRNLPSLQTLQLAQELVAAGLPLRSIATKSSSLNDEDETENGTDSVLGTSVESLLSQLTRSELSILRQCLWIPPQIHLPSLSSSAAESGKSKEQVLYDSIWGQIAGLEHVKDRLMTAISTLRPNQQQDTVAADAARAFASLSSSSGSMSPFSLSSSSSSHSIQPAGILLYGPPGCGKTLLVRALATTARLPCLVVTPSVLLRKYVGETNSQVRTLFSLANKLSPCIVCIDELDGLFRERNENEHEVSRDLKTEFLQWWDGMLSTSSARNGGLGSMSHGSRGKHHRPILVIGASNRPFDVDAAVLRRLPQSHFVGLPDAVARKTFLQQIVSQVPTEPTINLDQIALQTEGYSPSDLKQFVQTAAFLGPMKHSGPSTRPLTTLDLAQALPHAPPTPLSPAYRMALETFCSRRITAASPYSTANQHRDPFITSSPSSSTIGQASLPTSGGFWSPSSLTPKTMVWESEWGNFYDVGTLQVDHPTFDSLSELIKQLEDMSDVDFIDESDGGPVHDSDNDVEDDDSEDDDEESEDESEDDLD